MNKQELRAIMLIVNKLGWNDMPAEWCINNIINMVTWQQDAEIMTYGECDDFEETLLSLATWDTETIDDVYQGMVMTEVQEMSEFLGHYNIADTVTFYNKIWDKQYVDQMDYEDEMYWAWYDTMMSLRY